MASERSGAAFEGVVWLGGIVFVVIIASVVFAMIRRRMRPSTTRSGRSGFDLAELRQLKACGQLSSQEYDNLVQTMLADHESIAAGTVDRGM